MVCGMSKGSMKLHYDIPANDLTFAGEASSNVKKNLLN